MSAPTMQQSAQEDADTDAARPAVDMRAVLQESTVAFDRNEDEDVPAETTQFDRAAFHDELGEDAPLHLVVLDGSGLGHTVELGAGDVVVGRDPESTVMLTAKGVSRRHVVISATADGGHLLRDDQSANGTFVNKKRVDIHRLADGDLIFVGAASLKVMAGNNPEFAYYRYLHQTSVRDPLTDAPNRRYFDDFLVHEIERVRRYRRPLSLLMLDVDHFKRINDAEGHRAGDAVLRELVRVVSGRLRRSEFLARYGGEEFAVVAAETPASGALRLAESIRALVERHVFPWKDKRLVVTVSVGVAAWTDVMVDAGELVGLADERLYRAKRDGRNRVCGGPVGV